MKKHFCDMSFVTSICLIWICKYDLMFFSLCDNFHFTSTYLVWIPKNRRSEAFKVCIASYESPHFLKLRRTLIVVALGFQIWNKVYVLSKLDTWWVIFLKSYMRYLYRRHESIRNRKFCILILKSVTVRFHAWSNNASSF
jgi:hypothetical protein